MNYFEMTKENKRLEYRKLLAIYESYKNKNLNLDMSRGKPSEAQLDISRNILNIKIDDFNIDGFDVRNYGCLEGLDSVRELFAQLFDVKKSEVIIGGNSSLNLMHDIIMNLMFFDWNQGDSSKQQFRQIKFLCPVPGYDRHFAICEKFGIKMINVDMTSKGPDMGQIEALISKDEDIKGIWCVPQYSNPTGVTYSDDIVRRFANLEPKANDFKIFWDNAYAFHHLYEKHDNLLNLLNESKKNNKQDMVYIFSSTSKMIFPGSGLSVVISSDDNILKIKKWMSAQTIGYDKINQIRQLFFLKNAKNLSDHMRKHANILKPKFEITNQILEQNLKGLNLASWSKPRGGYFISLDLLDGCAKKVVELCKKAGVVFTEAGSTFPYKKDPNDKNIRLAPSFPPLDELRVAMELLCVAIKIASLERLL